MTLPIILNYFDDSYKAVEELKKSYFETYGVKPEEKEVSVWEFLSKKFLNFAQEYNIPPILMEMPLIGLERCDFIVVGKNEALIIEAKGWKEVNKSKNSIIVETDYGSHIDPGYQLLNYISKMKFFHASKAKISYRGILYMYNNNTYVSDLCINNHDLCKIVYNDDELKNEILSIGKPESNELKDKLKDIIEGKFIISDDLIDVIQKNKDDLLKKASNTLVRSGYGLSEEQAIIINKVMDSLRNGEEKTYLVRGESGSGKTLVALMILLEAVASGKIALLAYKNNRLLNTMRQLLTIKNGRINISTLIQYYSTGRGEGIGEPNFDMNKFENIDLIIYDEAQRMTKEVIKTTQKRSRVKVYFFDDSQILIGDEEGTNENFQKSLKNCERFELTGSFRINRGYLQFVRHLLWDEDFTGNISYDIKVFDDINEMLRDLNSKMEQNLGNNSSEKNKVALLCAFTESKGDKKNPKDINNRRLGFPLPSKFNIYMGKDVDIYWLMNEKTEYPRYWKGELDPLKYCASVYGAQGFEADYVGLVWGRDLIWKDQWQVNPQPITDNIGNSNSIKYLAKNMPEKALSLLKNRYYTLLTRGIRGIDIFFEDRNTGDHVKELMKELIKN
jgi:DUF2075 family protein